MSKPKFHFLHKLVFLQKIMLFYSWNQIENSLITAPNVNILLVKQIKSFFFSFFLSQNFEPDKSRPPSFVNG